MSNITEYSLTETEVNIICQALAALSDKYADIETEPDITTQIGLVALDDLTSKLLDGRSVDITIRNVLIEETI